MQMNSGLEVVGSTGSVSRMETKAKIMASGQADNSFLNQGLQAMKALRRAGRDAVKVLQIRSTSAGDLLVLALPHLGVNVVVTKFEIEHDREKITGMTECNRVYRFDSNGGKPIEIVRHPYDDRALQHFNNRYAVNEPSFATCVKIVVLVAIISIMLAIAYPLPFGH